MITAITYTKLLIIVTANEVSLCSLQYGYVLLSYILEKNLVNESAFDELRNTYKSNVIRN